MIWSHASSALCLSDSGSTDLKCDVLGQIREIASFTSRLASPGIAEITAVLDELLLAETSANLGLFSDVSPKLSDAFPPPNMLFINPVSQGMRRDLFAPRVNVAAVKAVS